jgi:hypothetical protein
LFNFLSNKLSVSLKNTKLKISKLNMTKNYKWTSEWEEKIKEKIPKQVDKTFKKGEAKPDGTVVTADAGETIKVKEVEELFREINEKKEEAKTKLDELNKLTGGGDELAKIYMEYDRLEKMLYLGNSVGVVPSVGGVDSWKAEKNKDRVRYDNFFGKGDGTTSADYYDTDAAKLGTTNARGWKNIQKAYYQKSFKKEDGSADATYSNLYEYKVRTEKDPNKDQDLRITEQEVVKLLTRSVKELQKIKQADWDAFVTSADCVLPATPTVKNRAANDWRRTNEVAYTGGTAGCDLKTWMDNVKTINLTSNEIKDESGNGTGRYTNGKRAEYFFKNITTTQLQSLFNLIEAWRGNWWNWQDKTTFQTAMTNAGIEDETTLIVLPAQTETDSSGNKVAKPVPESKLKEWGITGYTVNSTTNKTNYYLTDYGTQISSTKNDPTVKSEYSWDSKKEIKLEEGIKGWVELVFHTMISGRGSIDHNQERRLMSSLVGDPIEKLLDDINTSSDEYRRFGTPAAGTTKPFTLETEKQYSCEENRFYDLKARKKTILKTSSSKQEEIDKAEKAYNDVKKELNDKKTELEGKIAEKITELRTNLKTKYSKNGIGVGETYKGFKKTATEDNRIAFHNIHDIKLTIENIRYLEKGDDQEASSNPNEQTAYNELNALHEKLTKISPGDNPTDEEKKLDRVSFLIYGSRDVSETISYWKTFTEKPWQCFTWKDFEDSLDALENLIKLDGSFYAELRTEIKKQMTKQDDPKEKLPEWQQKLKAIDVLLEESVITEDKMKEFTTIENFKNIDEVAGFIKKVYDEDKTDPNNIKLKINADFVNLLKKEEAQVDDIAKAFKKWKADKIIKLITFYEYDKKLDDASKKERRRKFSWDRKKKVDDKYVETDGDYEEKNITDAEKKIDDGDFVKFLYELSTGAKKLKDIAKPAEQNDNPPTPTPNGGNGDKEMSTAKEWFGFGSVGKSICAYLGIFLVIGGVCAAIFWKNIAEWWNGPAADSDLDDKTEDDVDDSED